MLMGKHRLPINPSEEVKNLWTLDAELLPSDFACMEVEEEELDENKDVRSVTSDAEKEETQGATPAVKSLAKNEVVTLGALREVGIVPTDVRGVPLLPEEAGRLLPLWVGVLHVRICHYGPVTTHRMLKCLNINCSLELVKRTLQQCKACKCKVTHRNPEKKQVKKRARRITSPKEDQVEGTGPVEALDDAGKETTRKFNDLIYQDCIHFPVQSMDGNQFASVIIDDHTSLVSLMPIAAINSELTTQHLLSWISQYGCPFSVQTDNGPEFASHYAKTLLNHSILDRDGIAHRPQQQGKVERFNREIRRQVDLHLRHFGLPPIAWEWGLKALEYVNNRMPRNNLLSPLEMAGFPVKSRKLWPGDRVAFKPRGPSIEQEDTVGLRKLLVGRFHGFYPGKKALVSVLTPEKWMAVLVAKEELHPLPITTVDCVK